MKKDVIYHSAKSMFSYVRDENTLHIRLRTAKDDLKSVHLYGADPFEWTPINLETNEWVWNCQSYEMTKEFSTSLFDYYMISFNPPHQRIKYGFILNDGTEELLYVERGFFAIDDPYIRTDVNSFFAVPFMNEEDIFKAPAWVKDTVWYQIFPERFANGDTSNDPEGTLPWNSEDPWSVDQEQKFFGGDLQGIIDHLDHLEDVGVTGIYLTPIFESPTVHKYDTTNYMEIDPNFGDKTVFKELVEKAHERGLKVMLDAVFNHIGGESPMWQDVINNGESSKYKDWFHINQFPVTDEAGNLDITRYRTFGFVPEMPKLNTKNKEVEAYLLDVATYWVKEFNIDGWRLDVANEVSHEFWRKFREAVKTVNPDVYILGETWQDGTPYLLGDQFDSVMNYPLSKGILEFVATNTINDQEFIDTLGGALYRYSDNVNEAMFNLLDSHDTTRLVTLAKGHKEKVKLCYTLLFSLPGSPCIYYGSEYGITGEFDAMSRKCMPWGEVEDLDYFNHIRRVIALRKTYPVLGNEGRIKFLYNQNNTVIYQKANENEVVYYFVNNTEDAIQMPVLEQLVNQTVCELYENEMMTLEKTIEVGPYQAKIIKNNMVLDKRVESETDIGKHINHFNTDL